MMSLKIVALLDTASVNKQISQELLFSNTFQCFLCKIWLDVGIRHGEDNKTKCIWAYLVLLIGKAHAVLAQTGSVGRQRYDACLLYTSDAADE